MSYLAVENKDAEKRRSWLPQDCGYLIIIIAFYFKVLSFGLIVNFCFSNVAEGLFLSLFLSAFPRKELSADVLYHYLSVQITAGKLKSHMNKLCTPHGNNWSPWRPAVTLKFLCGLCGCSH